MLIFPRGKRLKVFVFTFARYEWRGAIRRSCKFQFSFLISNQATKSHFKYLLSQINSEIYEKGKGYQALYHFIDVFSTFHTPQIPTPHPKGPNSHVKRAVLLVYISNHVIFSFFINFVLISVSVQHEKSVQQKKKGFLSCHELTTKKQSWVLRN